METFLLFYCILLGHSTLKCMKVYHCTSAVTTTVRKGYWVKDAENPSHGSKLLRAVKHINCYNLRIK